MNITKVTSKTNTTACSKRTPKYLVIHYTAGTSSTAGHAKSIAQYFAKASTKASADFIVDDGTIVQFNPDPTTRYTWAVGGSKYTSMTTSEGGKYYGKCTNANSVSIEMCSSKKNTASLKATDTDWYITEATLNNAIECAKYVMKLYNIPASNVIMHHQVTGKVCPNPFCVNEAALAKWKSFKARLTAATTTTTTTSATFVGKVTENDLNVRTGPGVEYSIQTAWPKLSKGNLVDVLGTKLSKDNAKWYYIRIGGKVLGYVNSNYVVKA